MKTGKRLIEASAERRSLSKKPSATSPGGTPRYDSSKLGQWENVFSHTDRLGTELHVVAQEEEHNQGLDWGDLGIVRELYYREIIARFSHHPALI